MELDRCSALITGASAGIGLEFARQLASRATALILIARRHQRLKELRLQLAAENRKLRVEIRPTDLSKHDEIGELLRWLGHKNWLVRKNRMHAKRSFVFAHDHEAKRVAELI